jgi:hypothetical protein
MPRIPHGAIASIELEEAAAIVAGLQMPASPAAATAAAASREVTRFGYLFPDLQKTENAASRLEESPATVANLKSLGEAMKESGNVPPAFSNIPAGYTYFGQFVDHDVTFASSPLRPPDVPASCDFKEENLRVLPLDEVAQNTVNQREGFLQLEVIYGSRKFPAVRDGDRLRLGKLTESGDAIQGRDKDNDVPRQEMILGTKNDRSALIGDPRNDNNLIISQLHVAFLRAHNALVARGKSFAEAQRLLRQHYQWIVINDFLKEIADEKIVNDVLTRPKHLYDPPAGELFIPLEFAVAVYRFGHSMIRLNYYYNDRLPGVDFSALFPLNFLHVDHTPSPTLPDNRVIHWERFIRGAQDIGSFNRARRIDTLMVAPLFKLRDEHGKVMECETNLALMDLLRGYVLRMPTGQAVARELIADGRDIEVMTPDQIKGVAERANKKQLDVLNNSDFASRTPLWYYILAEADHFGQGDRLGPVGSTIVAEVLVGLVRRSGDSILSNPGSGVPAWSPMQTATGEFKLRDLLELAGVFDPNKKD